MKIKNPIPPLRAGAIAALERLKGMADQVNRRLESGKTERNRTLLLFVSLVLLMDYLMFSYHTGKNIFDIFPSIPVVSDKEKRTVYLPDPDGKTLLKETRKLSVPEDREMFVRMLYRVVVKGSIYDNTSMAVPIQTYIRHVWFNEGTCCIDLMLPVFKDNSARIAEGSERNFLTALEKTITGNIPSVKSVIVLENGIPGRQLWEIAAH